VSFEDSDLVPFDMLVAIQPFLTDAVWFTKVETNGTNSLKVFANATSNGQVNQFKARLERFVKIDTVELENIQSRPGGATFTAFLNFKTGSFSSRSVSEEVANNG
jgi:Tfp pilus assembly protein PilN